MEHVWRLTDPNSFIIALTEHLDNKTRYGDDMSVLSEAERIFYVTQTLEMEVNNGGFSQFFHNSSGKFANELVKAFNAIGAHATAAICQKATAVFDWDVPVERGTREDLLEEMESDEIDSIWEECDRAFYDYEDDLETLNHDFVMRNRKSFT